MTRRLERAADLGVPAEGHEMVQFAEFLDRTVTRLGWLHIPNEGKRSGRLGNMLKAQGMKKGAPDVLIFKPPPFYFDPWRAEDFVKYKGAPPKAKVLAACNSQFASCVMADGSAQPVACLGVAVEMKKSDATRSDISMEQLEWGAALARRGWYWFAARGAAEAIAELIRLRYASF